MKAIFNHLNHYKLNIKSLSHKLTHFVFPEDSDVNQANIKRALFAIDEVSKGYKKRSLLWFEKGSAAISGYLAKNDLGMNFKYNCNELFTNQGFGKTVLANVNLAKPYDSDSAALITFLRLSTEEIKVVLSKETNFCCVGSVDKDNLRYTSIAFAKNN
jgi:hypothetical protein